MRAHVLCIGGEDHALRIPFLLALRDRGFRVSAAATADPAPFARANIDVATIDGDTAVLMGGPPAGTTVVIVGVAELYGAEFEFQEG